MFEKYKKQCEDRGFLGMTNKEFTKVSVLVLLAVLCFAIIFSVLLPTIRTKPGEEEEGLVVTPERAGDRDALKALEVIKEKRIREQREGGEMPITPGSLEYPKPPAPFVEEPGIWGQVSEEAVNVPAEKPVLHYVLHQINSMTQEEIEKRVKEDGDLTEEEYGTDPAKYRGKFVSITGTLRELEDCPLEPNRSGVDRVWRGTLYNQQNKRFRNYYFYVTRKDIDYITDIYCSAKQLSRRGDLVQLDGVFVKLYTAELEGAAKKMVTYPFIVGKELVIVRELTYSELYPWVGMGVVSAVIGLIFVVIFFAVRRDSKTDREFKKEMHARFKKRIDDEFLRAHSKKHRDQKPGECGKGESVQKSESPSPESSAPPEA